MTCTHPLLQVQGDTDTAMYCVMCDTCECSQCGQPLVAGVTSPTRWHVMFHGPCQNFVTDQAIIVALPVGTMVKTVHLPGVPPQRTITQPMAFTLDELDQAMSNHTPVPVVQCECGSRSLGIKDYAPGHSSWCEVYGI